MKKMKFISSNQLTIQTFQKYKTVGVLDSLQLRAVEISDLAVLALNGVSKLPLQSVSV